MFAENATWNILFLWQTNIIVIRYFSQQNSRLLFGKCWAMARLLNQNQRISCTKASDNNWHKLISIFNPRSRTTKMTSWMDAIDGTDGIDSDTWVNWMLTECEKRWPFPLWLLYRDAFLSCSEKFTVNQPQIAFSALNRSNYILMDSHCKLHFSQIFKYTTQSQKSCK